MTSLYASAALAAWLVEPVFARCISLYRAVFVRREWFIEPSRLRGFSTKQVCFGEPFDFQKRRLVN